MPTKATALNISVLKRYFADRADSLRGAPNGYMHVADRNHMLRCKRAGLYVIAPRSGLGVYPAKHVILTTAGAIALGRAGLASTGSPANDVAARQLVEQLAASNQVGVQNDRRLKAMNKAIKGMTEEQLAVALDILEASDFFKPLNGEANQCRARPSSSHHASPQQTPSARRSHSRSVARLSQ